MELEEQRPTEPVYRLGRRPNAWQPPEWFPAHSDGSFGSGFGEQTFSAQPIPCVRHFGAD
jgi:hypothetical protein